MERETITFLAFIRPRSHSTRDWGQDQGWVRCKLASRPRPSPKSLCMWFFPVRNFNLGIAVISERTTFLHDMKDSPPEHMPVKNMAVPSGRYVIVQVQRTSGMCLCVWQWCSPRDQSLGLEAPQGQKWKSWSWSWIMKSWSWTFGLGLGREGKVLQFFETFVVILDGSEQGTSWHFVRDSKSSLPFGSHCLR